MLLDESFKMTKIFKIFNSFLHDMMAYTYIDVFFYKVQDYL